MRSSLGFALVGVLLLITANSVAHAEERACRSIFADQEAPVVSQLATLKFNIEQLSQKGDRSVARILQNDFTVRYQEAMRLGVELSSLPARIEALRSGKVYSDSADQKRLATAREAERALRGYRAAEYLPHALAGDSPKKSGSAAFSSDGQFVYTLTSNKLISRVNLKTSATSEVTTLGIRGDSIQLSADNSLILVSGVSNTAQWHTQVIATASGKVIFEQAAERAILSPDGKYLGLLIGHERTFKVIATADWSTFAEFKSGHYASMIYAFQFSANNQQLMVNVQGRVELWNVASGSREFAAKADNEGTASMSLHQNQLATFNSSSFRGTLYDPSGLVPERTLVGPTARVTSVVFSLDGHQVLAASQDGSIYVWSTHDGALLSTLAVSGKPGTLVLSPDGNSFAVSVNEHDLQVFRTSAE